jgi:hypothetical protein
MVDADRVGREAALRHDVWRRVVREAVELPRFAVCGYERQVGNPQPFVFSLHGIEE